MPSVVIRVTERCNAYCRYCTFSRKPRGATMDLGVVDLLLRQVDDYLCANTDKTMELLWHGGEPLLPGLRFYQRVIQLQRERCRGTHGRIVHRVQTNLTCLSDRLLPVLQELGVTELGTSFDPEPGVRGLGPSVDTAKYLERFFRALRLVEAAELRWGVLYVVTGRSRSEPEGVFLLLTNLQPEGRISFIPVMDTPAEAADLRLSPEEFAHFLGSFLPHWWRRRDRFPAVEPFQGFLSAAARDGSEATEDEAPEHLNVMTDGSVGLCRRGSVAAVDPVGNLATDTLGDLFALVRDRHRAAVRTMASGACPECRFWAACLGGARLDAFSQNAPLGNPGPWCEARRIFVERYLEPITGVVFR